MGRGAHASYVWSELLAEFQDIGAEPSMELAETWLKLWLFET